MFDMDKIVPITLRTPEVFYQKLAEFGEWFQSLPTDCPLELHLTVGPFDRCAREWSYRRFTDEELATMIPCHRIIVGCMNTWCDNVEQFEYGTVQAPEDMVNDESFSWGEGLQAAIYASTTLFADAQTNYLARVYRDHGFDHNKFLADTDHLDSPEAIGDFLEAMLYVCELENIVEEAESDPVTASQAMLMKGMAREMRDHMYRTWEEWKNTGVLPNEQDGEVK